MLWGRGEKRGRKQRYTPCEGLKVVERGETTLKQHRGIVDGNWVLERISFGEFK